MESYKSVCVDQTTLSKIFYAVGAKRDNTDWIYHDGRDLYVGGDFNWIGSQDRFSLIHLSRKHTLGREPAFYL